MRKYSILIKVIAVFAIFTEHLSVDLIYIYLLWTLNVEKKIIKQFVNIYIGGDKKCAKKILYIVIPIVC